MAAKDFDSDDIKKQELDDITACCICTEVYTDPKALPCIHTFCMRCIQETGLKANKNPGDQMPCPICRQMFKIPTEGFHGLPKNLAIERLLQVAHVSDPSAASRAVCDACLEDENEEMGKEIPLAEKYCVDCKRKLCEDCCSEHRNFKLTKKHEMIPMTEYESGQIVMEELAPGVCELHEQNAINVYCTDCKTVVCAICFIDDHKNHDGSHVNKFEAGFRKQIESGVEAMNKCKSTAEAKKAELVKLKEDIQERVENLERDVEKRKDELNQLIEKHAISILQDLCSIRQSKLKEIQMTTDDVDTHLSSLETYNSYCQNVMTKGSASDVCNAFSELLARAAELEHQCQLINDIAIKSVTLSFGKSEVEQFLTESCDNLIGEIQEEGESRSKKTGKQIVSRVQSTETDLLNLRSASEPLRIDINNEVEANKAHKMTINTLKDSVEKLEQELSRMKQDQHWFISDPVFIETIKTKSAKVDKKAIRGLTILDNELFVVSKESSEIEVYDSIKLSFNRRWNLKELVDPADIGSCNINKCLYIMDYKDHRHSAAILRVDPKGKLIRKWSTGYIRGCLSVTDESNVILADYWAYKLYEYSPEGQIIHEIGVLSGAGIRYPRHAIKLTNELFVVSHGYFDPCIDNGDSGDANVDAYEDNDDDGDYNDGNDDSGDANVDAYEDNDDAGDYNDGNDDSGDANVDDYEDNDDDGDYNDGNDCGDANVDAYKDNDDDGDYNDGNDCGEANADAYEGNDDDGDYNDGNDDRQRVFIVDAGGKLKRSFGGERGSAIGQLNDPAHLSVDGNGFIMVADRGNSRILLLDSNFQFMREILSKEKHGLRYPSRTLLDGSSGRLFVVDNEKNPEKMTFLDGRILIFDF